MAKLLNDRELERLVGDCILEGSREQVRANAYKLRLGGQVRFHSTGEIKSLEQGQFIEIGAGEAVTIASLEKLDFTADTVGRLHPGRLLWGLIMPTTTMMREGITQVATQIDAGFRGQLNWLLRNNTTKPSIIRYGESIFKLTLWLLDPGEAPEQPYGVSAEDSYHDSEGIVASARTLPADIRDDQKIRATDRKIDPKRKLQEAGYPFNYIGTELVALDGKFETVSKDVILLKREIEEQTENLSTKIREETASLSERMAGLEKSLVEKMEELFSRKATSIWVGFVGSISLLVTVYTFLDEKGSARTTGFVFLGVAVVCLMFFLLVLRRK
ncbi:MAG TPA: hypothetical protein VM118_09800 [Acidobacteriota bacterium]|nr:hypothetical protein [Acidobacteriota bacterium]